MNIKEELRRGNYIKCIFSENDYSIVEGVDSEYIYIKETTYDYLDVEHIELLLLNKKWLDKFNFGGRDDFRYLNDIGVQIINDIYYFAIKDLGNVIFHSIVEIEYVHELQNLYYDIKKEKLI